MSPPVQKVFSDEHLPASADVVVIGGGIAGVSAAYALARKGHSVALLKRASSAASNRVAIGDGAGNRTATSGNWSWPGIAWKSGTS